MGEKNKKKKFKKKKPKEDLEDTPVLIWCSGLANVHMQISEISGGMHTWK